MSTVQVAALPRRFVDAFTHDVRPTWPHVPHSHSTLAGRRRSSDAAARKADSDPPGRLTTPERL